MPAYFTEKPEGLSESDKRTARIATARKLERSRTIPLKKSGSPPRKTAPKRKTPVVKINRRRKKSEFARTYHSKERVAFVKSLPCFATGKRGQSDNAHVTRDGSEGMGRKGGYRCIAPLSREAHRLFDTNPARFTERYGEFDPAAMAAWTQQQWEAFAAREGLEP